MSYFMTCPVIKFDGVQTRHVSIQKLMIRILKSFWTKKPVQTGTKEGLLDFCRAQTSSGYFIFFSFQNNLIAISLVIRMSLCLNCFRFSRDITPKYFHSKTELTFSSEVKDLVRQGLW